MTTRMIMTTVELQQIKSANQIMCCGCAKICKAFPQLEDMRFGLELHYLVPFVDVSSVIKVLCGSSDANPWLVLDFANIVIALGGITYITQQ